MNSNETPKFDHSRFDDIFGDNLDREAMDQPSGKETVNAADLPKPAADTEYETVTVTEFDTELGYVTETIKVKKAIEHTITAEDDDRKDFGDLTIRIRINAVYIGGEDQLNIQVYGWRNDDPQADDAFVGEYEVDMLNLYRPDDGSFEEDGEATFTLTQKQIDDALALYDELYMSEES